MAKKKSKDPLELARTAPKSVKHLCLNPGALAHQKVDYEPTKTFPREVLACVNLESLDLFRGIAWDGDNSIPAEIGKLQKLRDLTLGGLTMKKMPDAIGNLTELRVLSLDYAESLVELPSTIGNLKNLEELALSYTEKLRALPSSIGRLSKLKQLSCSDSALKTVPTELWNCKSLATLSLPETVTSLPPGISKLTKLESLFLSSKALASIASELPKLVSLKSLGLHQGERGALPEEVGALPHLAELHVAFAGLSSLPASLMGHATLGDLDVSGNKLASLESLVASLPKLEALDFSDNPLDRAEKRRIDAMMKLPPKKRRVNTPLAPKSKWPKPKSLGTVMSENASILMVIGDPSVIKTWHPERYERLCDVLSKRDVGKIDGALALTLGVGQGVVRVYQVGEEVVLVEGFLDNWKDVSFLEDLAHPADGKVAQSIDVKTGIAILWGPEKKPQLVVKTKAGKYDLVVEKEKNSSWGSARRAIFKRV